VLFGALTIFCMWCLVSSVANQNSLKPTVFGTFAYIVYFLVFFVFSSIPYKKSLIKMNYAFLLKFALFLASVSILQEILAFIHPFSDQWWPNIQKESAIWRFGLFRAPSLLGHPNGIGMYALIFFTVELARIREHGSMSKWVKITILGLAILFSLSRTAIGGALIALFLVLPLFRRRLMFFLPVIVLTGALIYNLFGFAFLKNNSKFKIPDPYREYTFNKSIEIFKDNSLFGIGPGMYGGHISLKYGSDVYLRYGFEKRHYDYLRNVVGSIEQQWVQILAEIGVPGLFLFVFLILTPMFILYKLKKSVTDPLMLAIINGFMIMPFQMGLYMFSFTLSQQQQWLFPYFAFLGMLVGAQRRDNIAYNEKMSGYLLKENVKFDDENFIDK